MKFVGKRREIKKTHRCHYEDLETNQSMNGKPIDAVALLFCSGHSPRPLCGWPAMSKPTTMGASNGGEGGTPYSADFIYTHHNYYQYVTHIEELIKRHLGEIKVKFWALWVGFTAILSDKAKIR